MEETLEKGQRIPIYKILRPSYNDGDYVVGTYRGGKSLYKDTALPAVLANNSRSWIGGYLLMHATSSATHKQEVELVGYMVVKKLL